jgi:hypothetical protein
LGKIKETRKEKELLLEFQRLISGQKVRRRGEVEEEGRRKRLQAKCGAPFK